jgi:hypothetical protein
MDVGPIDHRWDREVRGIHARQVPTMLANGFGFLAIFSLITILFGEAARRKGDVLADVWFLDRYTGR